MQLHTSHRRIWNTLERKIDSIRFGVQRTHISSLQCNYFSIFIYLFFFEIFSTADRKGAELPTPKQILYPREKVKIGWKGSDRKWVPGAGMINVGNTCYLNSTLQALFHVPAFANWLMSDYVHRETCEEKSKYTIILPMVAKISSKKET